MTPVPINGRQRSRTMTVSERVEQIHDVVTPAISVTLQALEDVQDRLKVLEGLAECDLRGRLRWLIYGK